MNGIAGMETDITREGFRLRSIKKPQKRVEQPHARANRSPLPPQRQTGFGRRKLFPHETLSSGSIKM